MFRTSWGYVVWAVLTAALTTLFRWIACRIAARRYRRRRARRALGGQRRYRRREAR